jgi:hypothetical protein
MALVLTVICLVVLLGKGQGKAPVRWRYYEFTFDQAHPAAHLPSDVVHVYVATSMSGRVAELYSVMRRSSGTIEYETLWTDVSPRTELTRDWTSCSQTRRALSDSIPQTLPALETSALGPVTAPPGATFISPDTWQFGQGVAIMTVHQLGAGITDRVVSVGLPGHAPGTVITGASLTAADAIPALSSAWNSCHPHRN